MKICQKCGTECDNAAEICPVCKSSLDEKLIDDKPYSETFNKYNTKHLNIDSEEATVEPQKKRLGKGKLKTLFVLTGIAAIAIIVVIAVLSYKPDRGIVDSHDLLSIYTADDEAAEGAVVLQGLVNSDGEILLSASYQKVIAEIDNGLYAVIGSNSKIGAINRNGKEEIPCSYMDCDSYGFRDGLWAVFDGSSWGYINKKGEYKIPSQYDDASAFFNGLAAVCVDGKWGYINKSGETVIDYTYDEAGIFCDGLARVCRDGLYGFIDKDGKSVIAPVYDYAYPHFSDGLCLIKYGNRYGYIDEKGEWIVNPQFDAALPFSEGLAAVSLEGMVGYIDKTGTYVIKPQYVKLSEECMFYDGMAAVTTADGASMIIDKAGNFVSDKYAEYTYADARFDGFILVQTEEKYGLLSPDCSEYIYDPTYANYVTAYIDTVVFYDEVQEKYIYINATGEVINTTKNIVKPASIPSYSMDLEDIFLNEELNAE